MNFNKLFSLVKHPEFFGNVKLERANVPTSPTTYCWWNQWRVFGRKSEVDHSNTFIANNYVTKSPLVLLNALIKLQPILLND